MAASAAAFRNDTALGYRALPWGKLSVISAKYKYYLLFALVVMAIAALIAENGSVLTYGPVYAAADQPAQPAVPAPPAVQDHVAPAPVEIDPSWYGDGDAGAAEPVIDTPVNPEDVQQGMVYDPPPPGVT
jgi:hypothetical protein